MNRDRAPGRYIVASHAGPCPRLDDVLIVESNRKYSFRHFPPFSLSRFGHPHLRHRPPHRRTTAMNIHDNNGAAAPRSAPVTVPRPRRGRVDATVYHPGHRWPTFFPQDLALAASLVVCVGSSDEIFEYTHSTWIKDRPSPPSVPAVPRRSSSTARSCRARRSPAPFPFSFFFLASLLSALLTFLIR